VALQSGVVPDGTAPAATTLIDRSVSRAFVVWAARLAWITVAVLGGPAVGGAVADRSRAVQLAATLGAWVGWTLGAGALAVAGVPTLTVARAVVPGALVVAIVAVGGGADTGSAILLIAPAAIASALVGSAEFGRHYIQASAYGDEERFGLRPPLGYLVASGVSWLLTATALVLGPVAWAATAWTPAVVATTIAAAGVLVLPVRWHQLSRRWFVIVPAGLVVHDPVVLRDTLMVPARTVAAVTLDETGLARRRAADLTGPTPGAGLELALSESTTAVFAATPGHPAGRAVHASALLIAPTRPGSVLRALRARGYPLRPGDPRRPP
jgi:hypothetical protein